MSAPNEPAPSGRERDRVRDRMAMDYDPPVLEEPTGGPVPDWAGDPDTTTEPGE